MKGLGWVMVYCKVVFWNLPEGITRNHQKTTVWIAGIQTHTSKTLSSGKKELHQNILQEDRMESIALVII
jgi:hypothetical protein